MLIDASGDCHLTDFGVARALQAAHLTVSGEFVGTAAYLAPEQITAVDVGPAADIYALGLLLLECLTGHTEYTGTTIEAALARLNRPPRIPDTLPPAWHTLLTAMTAQDPHTRPGARRCAETLNAIAGKRTPGIDAVPPMSAPRVPGQPAGTRCPDDLTSEPPARQDIGGCRHRRPELGQPRQQHPRPGKTQGKNNRKG